VTVNVLGFMAVAHVGDAAIFSGEAAGTWSGFRLLQRYVAIVPPPTRLRKPFQSGYLDGLRKLARHTAHPIIVTEVQPGFVDTAMMKPDRMRSTLSSSSSSRRPVREAAHRVRRTSAWLVDHRVAIVIAWRLVEQRQSQCRHSLCDLPSSNMATHHASTI
jgi:hypothetical protein